MTEPASAPGGFNEAELRSIVRHACNATRLNPARARLLRGHTNAVVLLPEAAVVMKVARRGTPIEKVRRTVCFVQWLVDRGFPTVPLHPGLEQPVVIDGHAVTFWTYLPQPEGLPVAASKIAKPLFALHNLPTPPLSLPQHDNIRAIRASLATITSLPAAALRFLSDRADRLEVDLEHVAFALPEGPLQGDPQHRNALHQHGDAVLCDWDTVAIGRPEWDLVTIEVHCRRFGYEPSHYRDFADTYGFDVTVMPHYRTLRDLRELRMITTNARKTHHAPQSVHEVKRRVEGLRREDLDLTWHIL
ncbi:aminoglycoside phosphotransferase family protein [Streptomyces sp. p1417]|uniref:Aminoglycoside phosphotransferase family protein n=1 Tax=Streptomyces typhae TaxID=2681492 RepID=A0A6L6X963_9ACTN|nr:phosphotransferase [Streptomyces typhae]MVO90221.1 aminoglycoside phosphotransferase family protein [Streptomyces typhae]